MTEASLPAAVRALLHGPVSSMAHVEALLLLRRHQPGALPVAQVAGVVRIASVVAARRCLDELVAAGLVAVAEHDEYRYVADGGDAHAAVDALARMYNEKPVTLVRAIYSRPASPPPARPTDD